MSYPKLTPITAKGATEPRYLEDRFADVVNVRDFGAKGDGVTDDTEAFQAALNLRSGIEVRGCSGDVYYLPNTIFIRQDNVILNLDGTKITTDNYTSPVFSLSDPSDTSISPDNVVFKNIEAEQTSVVVDISSTDFYPGSQPDDWKIASLIHRGKCVGKTTYIENVKGKNFINLVSNFGDWEDTTVLAGPLIMRNIRTSKINFGLLDNGCEHLDVDGWYDEERVAIQYAGGSIMPPHTIYSTNHDCQKTNYFIRNIFDFNTVHGSCLKLRQVTGFHISNVFGVKSPSLVDLFNCDNGSVISCSLTDPTDDPSVTLSQSAFLINGCRNVKFIDCSADCNGDRKLVRSSISNETGSEVDNAGVYFQGHANFLSSGYAIQVNDGGGVSFDISITSNTEQAVNIGILRDSGQNSPALGDVIVNVRSIMASTPSTLVPAYVAQQGSAKVYFPKTGMVNISAIDASNSLDKVAVYTIPSGKFRYISNETIEFVSSPTGYASIVASNTSSSNRGIIEFDHNKTIWGFSTNGARRAIVGNNGMQFLVPSAQTLDTNGFLGFEAPSNSQINIVFKGSDGVIRKASLTLQ